MERKDTILTDEKGRKLTLRGMNLVEQYRLAKAVGADTARNDIAWSMAQTAASIRDIDGMPLCYPTTDRGVELNIGLIGDEGYAAFIGHLQAETARAMAAAKAAADASKAAGESDPGPLPPSA